MTVTMNIIPECDPSAQEHYEILLKHIRTTQANDEPFTIISTDNYVTVTGRQTTIFMGTTFDMWVQQLIRKTR